MNLLKKDPFNTTIIKSFVIEREYKTKKKHIWEFLT